MVKNLTIAEAVGRDESWVSKLVAGETGVKIDQMDNFLESLGMKLVPKDAVVVDEAYLKALRVLAGKELERK